ncbi:MAG: divalent metal cation transporter [Candidatus Obscuribacterales bacterium]|nr:divalent metal cation transporter [Candidatus Obscuribacterales bacterium]
MPAIQKENAVKKRGVIKDFFRALGPGLITGASDDDPSGIATYTVTGAKYGYSFLWAALVTFPMMSAVQYLCAKIAIVYKKSLCQIISERYPKPIVQVVVWSLLIANVLNAGANIAAVSAGIHLLIPGPQALFSILVGIFVLVFQFVGSYERISSVFKWLTLALFAYIGTAFFIKIDTAAVISSTFIPKLEATSDYCAALVAILGTTISPYLFFWQSQQEAANGKPIKPFGFSSAAKLAVRKEDEKRIGNAVIDVNTGMLLSNVVMYFIILVSAATLHSAGKYEINTAADAAAALTPLAGPMASALFAVGIIGSGLLSIPVLTFSAAGAFCQAFNWRDGLTCPPYKAKQYYVILSLSTLVAVLIAELKVSPIAFLFWSAVINGILAPPLLLIIMLISNDKQVSKEQPNGTLVNSLGWLTTVVMALAVIALVISSL